MQECVAFFFGEDSGYFKYHIIFLAEYCKPYLPIIFCCKIKSYLGLYYTIFRFILYKILN